MFYGNTFKGNNKRVSLIPAIEDGEAECDKYVQFRTLKKNVGDLTQDQCVRWDTQPIGSHAITTLTLVLSNDSLFMLTALWLKSQSDLELEDVFRRLMLKRQELAKKDTEDSDEKDV